MKPTRGPGRPPLDDAQPSVKVCLTLPTTTYDDLYTRAHQAQLSVPAWIRRTLTTAPDEADED